MQTCIASKTAQLRAGRPQRTTTGAKRVQGAVRVSCTAERAEVSGRRMASAGLVAGLAGLVASKAEANVCAANPTACVQGKPVSKYLEENPAKKPSDDSISGIIGFVLVAIGSFESLRLTGGKAVGLRQK
eukprot:jgi/Pico_ML_1/50688/g1855.t1